MPEISLKCRNCPRLKANKTNDLVNDHTVTDSKTNVILNRPGFPGEYFICELRLPDHYFRWKHNKLFLLLPEEYGP
ncbi:hypothetical protein, partial [Escherichia coli]|uniref:hypothetical protein n=1 Tax=Escherichia coli TaxID=562 RepID=UPI001980B807